MKSLFYKRTLKKIMLSVSVVFLFVNSGCVSLKHLPTPAEFNDYPYGTYTNVFVRKDYRKDITGSAFKSRIDGELIGIQEDTLVLLTRETESKLLFINLNKIDKVFLNLSSDSNSPQKYNIYTGLFAANSLLHGFLMIYSLIFNLGMSFFTAPSTFKLKYPKEISLDEMRKFSRFPQGLPDQDLNRIQIAPRLVK